MAKYIRTKKVRRVNWNNLIMLVFVMALAFSGFTSIFAGAENARLTKAIDIKREEVAHLEDSNLETARELNDLRGYATIIAKAEEALMDFNLNNIVVVKSESNEEATK